jgi:hypothetical protein
MLRTLPALLAAIALLAPSAHACTLSPVHYTRSVRLVLFLGAARTDTLLVGSGGVTVSPEAGHFGAGPAREVYGQVVGVERVGEPWQSLLPRGTREVVLVPWDYAADCSPVFWSRSARWLAPGTSGLFRGTLREPRYWVRGRPTLDVFAPEFEPYPMAAGLARDLRIGRSSDAPLPEMLSPADALEFLSRLPTDSAAWAQPDTAVAAVRRWAEAHPNLAARWPAATVLHWLVSHAEDMRFRRRTSPLAGTYRFTVTFASGDTVVLFGRSEANLLGEIRSLSRGDPRLVDSGPPVGYYLLTHFSLRPDELPTRHTGPDRQGYLAALFSPLLETPDSSVYRGSVDLLGVVPQIDTRPSVSAFVREVQRLIWSPQGGRDGELGDPATFFAPGFFTSFPDGRLRFEWLGRRGDTTVVAIRGERISAETLVLPGPR